MQQRGRLTRERDVSRAAVRWPATFYAFDLLLFGGYDLRRLPLLERKRLLTAFGSAAAVRRATRQELVPLVGPAAADALLAHFGSLGSAGPGVAAASRRPRG